MWVMDFMFVVIMILVLLVWIIWVVLMIVVRLDRYILFMEWVGIF